MQAPRRINNTGLRGVHGGNHVPISGNHDSCGYDKRGQTLC